MRTTALIFLAIGILSGLIALYAPPENGLPQIMVWLFLAFLVVAAGLTFASLGRGTETV